MTTMPTGPRRSRGSTAADPPEAERRDQEVLRANRELAAYFRGMRTEREARSALKIIKAFIRDRERVESAKRRPLPGAKKPTAVRKREKASKRRRAPAQALRRERVKPETGGNGSAEVAIAAGQSNRPV